jgi:hypothetical protein
VQKLHQSKQWWELRGRGCGQGVDRSKELIQPFHLCPPDRAMTMMSDGPCPFSPEVEPHCVCHFACHLWPHSSAARLTKSLLLDVPPCPRPLCTVLEGDISQRYRPVMLIGIRVVSCPWLSRMVSLQHSRPEWLQLQQCA